MQLFFYNLLLTYLRKVASKYRLLFYVTNWTIAYLCCASKQKQLFQSLSPCLQAKDKIAAKRIEASLHLVALKKLNRLEKVRTRAGRDALNKEKQRVDSTHLLLQNLLYEADHLNKEVTKCLKFKSKDEEIELVSLDDFYKEAPEQVTRPVRIKFLWDLVGSRGRMRKQYKWCGLLKYNFLFIILIVTTC